MFQKGISSLLKAQYKLALDYLGIFEASNIAQFAELEGYEHNSDYNYLKMLSVELDYSKGICLRHMSMAEESLMYYSQAYYKNIDLLCSLNIKERPEFTGDYFDQAGEDPLNRYVFDKPFKILEDYINLLYDTKYFRQASEILNDLIFRLENSEFVIPDEMRDIVYTTYNEVALLDVIHCKECNEKDAIIKFKDLPMNHGLETYPFCNVLNKYFQLVYEIVCKQKDLKKNKSKIEKLENDLSNALKYAICSQPLPKCGECNKELFAGWILGDIKNIVKDAKMKSDVRDTIYYYTAMVEDCIRQIEGRKRQEIY